MLDIERNYMLRKFSVIIVVLFAVIFDAAKVAKAETIVIAAENDWIPYAKENGTGLANEIIVAAFASLGIVVEYDIFPYARVLQNIERGKHIAGFNVPLDEQSNRKYILGEEKLFDAVSAYYQNISRPIQVRSREELSGGVIVGVVRDYGYGDHYLGLVEKRLITEYVSNSEVQNLKRLALGRIDSTIIYNKTANILLKQLNLKSKIEFAFINESTPIFLAFSRAHPKGQYYSDKFDLGMKNIRRSGVYQKIMDSY